MKRDVKRQMIGRTGEFDPPENARERRVCDELKDFVCRQIRAKRAANNGVTPDGLISQEAREIGVDTRTVYKWLCPSKTNRREERPAFRLSPEHIDSYYRLGCSIARVREELRQKNAVGLPSERTFQRAAAVQIDPAERAVYRGGMRELYDENVVYTDFTAEHRNDVWQIDHVDLKFEAIFEGMIQRIHATCVVDVCTGAIPGLVLCINPNSTSIAAALGIAVVDHPQHRNPFKGQPKMCRCDLGTDFKSQHARDVIRAIHSVTDYCPGYHPWAKGCVERLQGIVISLLRGRPGYVRGPQDLDGTRHPIVGDMLALEDLELVVEQALDYYHHRPQRGRGNKSPIEVFEACHEPLREIEDWGELAECLVRPADRVRCGKQGIPFAGRKYQSPRLMLSRKRWFELGYLFGDHSRIAAFSTDGKFFDLLSETKAGGKELREKCLEGRRELIKQANAGARLRHLKVAETQRTMDNELGITGVPAEVAALLPRAADVEAEGADRPSAQRRVLAELSRVTR